MAAPQVDDLLVIPAPMNGNHGRCVLGNLDAEGFVKFLALKVKVRIPFFFHAAEGVKRVQLSRRSFGNLRCARFDPAAVNRHNNET
jgi:hypothetical protein